MFGFILCLTCLIITIYKSDFPTLDGDIHKLKILAQQIAAVSCLGEIIRKILIAL